MWELRTQLNKPNPENTDGNLEWSAVYVDTQEEAEAMWRCRTGMHNKCSVHTMYGPDGNLVRTRFK